MSRLIISSFAAVVLAATTMIGSAAADSTDWSLPAITDNAPTCTVTAVGGDDLTGMYPDGRMIVNGNVVSGEFEVTGDSTCKVDITLTTWNAPNNTDGKPYDQQTIFDTKTQQYSVGLHDITVHIPDCNFQADLVRGDAPAGYNGSPIYETGRMMASLHGGTQDCAGMTTTPGQGGGCATTPPDTTPVTPPVDVPPVTPVAPVTPSTPMTVVTPGMGGASVPATITTITVPATLPEAGASDSSVLLAALAGSIGALVRKRQQRTR